MKILTYKEKWLSARTSSKILVFWKESILYSTATIDTLLGLLSKRGETKKSSRHLIPNLLFDEVRDPKVKLRQIQSKKYHALIIRGPFIEGRGGIFKLSWSSKRVRVSLICTWHIWEGPKKQALHWCKACLKLVLVRELVLLAWSMNEYWITDWTFHWSYHSVEKKIEHSLVEALINMAFLTFNIKLYCQTCCCYTCLRWK